MKDRLPYMPFFVADYMGSTDCSLDVVSRKGGIYPSSVHELARRATSKRP